MSAYRALTLAGLVAAQAARTPDALAIAFDGDQWTYRRFAARVAQVANFAASRGISAGDRVLLCAPNSPEYLAVVLGVSSLGAAVATPNPQLSQPELDAVSDDCIPRLAFLDDRRDLPGIATIRCGTELDCLLDAASDHAVDCGIDETATFAIAYTSGTTGLPKGVMLSHRSRALTAMAAAIEYRCFGPGHRFLGITPLCHGAGFAYAVANLLLGGTLELERDYDTDRVIQRLAGDALTGIFVVPTILRRLLDAGLVTGPRLSAIICNAAALAQPLKERAVAALGDGLLHETYGSTEAGIVANLQPVDQLTTSNSVGRPFLGVEVSLRAADGCEVATGLPGELFARGPYGFNGYLNRPDATAEAVHDNWVTVGDIAIRDERGFLHIVDRKGDLIITGGLNVYPREIETVLLACPGVADAAVIGIADPEWGERIHAVVVRMPGSAVAIDALDLACAAHLASYKRPKTIAFVDMLPRSAAGKLMRRELVAASV